MTAAPSTTTLDSHAPTNAPHARSCCGEKGTGFESLRGAKHPSGCMYFARTSSDLCIKLLKAFNCILLKNKQFTILGEAY